MKSKFENLGIWEFGNAEGQASNTIQAHKFELMGQAEHMELAQFGRVLHDWRPKGKKRNSKQEADK